MTETKLNAIGLYMKRNNLTKMEFEGKLFEIDNFGKLQIKK